MNISKTIESKFPEFILFNDGLDNIKFIDLENLAAILNDLIYISKLGIIPESQQRYFTDKKIKDYFKNTESYIGIIFDFINDLFAEEKEALRITFLETLSLNKFGDDYCKKYLKKEVYDYFSEKFPYEKYKDSWDASTFYTEEEYQRILNLPDVDDN